jgi:hypothetical protein
LIEKIFGKSIKKLKAHNTIIDDVRIDEDETTFNDLAVAAIVSNSNKKQEVQRVHDPKTEYGKN